MVLLYTKYFKISFWYKRCQYDINYFNMIQNISIWNKRFHSDTKDFNLIRKFSNLIPKPSIWYKIFQSDMKVSFHILLHVLFLLIPFMFFCFWHLNTVFDLIPDFINQGTNVHTQYQKIIKCYQKDDDQDNLINSLEQSPVKCLDKCTHAITLKRLQKSDGRT